MRSIKLRFMALVVSVAVLSSLAVGCGTKTAAPSNAPAAAGTQQAAAKKVDYPKGDITFIIPNAPGGGNDLTVRSLIPGLEKALKVKVVPENKPASRGAVAFMDIINGKPDGSRLYFNSMTALQLAYSGVPEAKIEKMTPVAQVVEDAAIIFVRKDSPLNSLQDLINQLKTSKTKIKTANTGLGALWHVVEVVFSKAIGADNMHYISFPSGSPAMLTALASGEVDVVFCGPEAKSFMDAGKVKPLGVLTEKRYPSFPDVKTAKEQGLDLVYPIWRGLFTTGNTDPEIIKVLEASVKAATESEEFKKYASVGMTISFKGTEEFKKIVENESKTLAKVMPEIMKEVENEAAKAPAK